MRKMRQQARIKVLFVTTVAETVHSFYRGYFRYLADNGFDVYVCCRPDASIESFTEAQGARFTPIEFSREIRIKQDFKSLIRCIRIIRKVRPTVVVCSTPKASLIGLCAAWLNRVPVRMYQLWGLRLETEFGWMRFILSVMEKLTVRAATIAVANSKSLADRAVVEGLCGHSAPIVLGSGSSHGVDEEYYAPGEGVLTDSDAWDFLSERENTLKIGFIGRINKDKGVPTLIDAFEQCLADGYSMSLILVGDFEDKSCVDKIEKLVRAGVAFHANHVNDVRGYINHMDVICLPTLREGFPNVILEAASMEVPAVVSDATGAMDSVEDGVTGWIFPVGEAASLKKKLEWLEENPDQIETAGKRARLRIKTDFTRSKVWNLQLSALVDACAEIKTDNRSN